MENESVLTGEALDAGLKALEEGRLFFRVSDGYGRSCNGGNGRVKPSSEDKPGEWTDVVANPSICNSGWHATTNPLKWAGQRVVLVEVDEVCEQNEDKVVCHRLRELGVVLPWECVDERVWVGASRPNLSGANLYGANLSRANLSRADLSRANLSGADLSGANLSGANLSVANLSRANLYGADLSGANLSVANLSRANLYGADLYGADLSGANLYGADLSGANLSRANLSGANLSGADLSVADLSRARYTEYTQLPKEFNAVAADMLLQ